MARSGSSGLGRREVDPCISAVSLKAAALAPFRQQPKRALSSPIIVPGSSESFYSFRVATPRQADEERRPAFARQSSDTELDTLNPEADGFAAAAAEPRAAIPAAKPVAKLAAFADSWTARVRHFELPAQPTGFPSQHGKERKGARPQQGDADVAWRHKFRQKWRREQIRALYGGPDGSPSGSPISDGAPADDDMMFGLDDFSPAAAPLPQQPSLLPQGPTPPAAAEPLQQPAQQQPSPAAVAPAHDVPVLPPIKVSAPAQPTGEVLQAAFPGGGTIRKVTMRGAAPHAAGKATVPERKWAVPKMKSPLRACQAA